ncbi:MAG TPA: DUF4430 domain-containing protein [Candidatus Paceibacterota bacterium]|nr:DUF4430 domain-containing protein [Candidatus Paceibacterota bacterium]HPT18341.1 DUF4430 domain-containing protein [Candidatus Paceibacterota bacterium]
MKKIKNLILIITILFTSIVGVAHAEEPIVVNPPTTNIHLTVNTNEETLYDQNIDVSACDSSNPSSSTLAITAYCAILQSPLQSDWNFDWAPGIFLNSINNIAGFTTKDSENNDVYHYWSWSLNSNYASMGLNQYELQSGDLITLTFIDPQTEPEVVEIVKENKHSSSGSIVSSVKNQEKIIFDYKKALDFLSSQQKENGSFGEELYTDWATIAFSSSADYQDQKTKLTKYFLENKFLGTSLTDYERHAMALMSLNLNPYNINGENYIQKIISEFKNNQFGDLEQDNDDIFALVVLQNAEYTKDENIISDTIKFILSKQKENGSWDNSIDLTGAGIEALSNFKENIDVKNSLEKARLFLQENQKNDGGWENVSATAWSIQGILGFGEKIEDWKKNDKNYLDYLAINQDSDGGIKNENKESKIWETSYSVISASGKTWNQIMQKFSKEEEKTEEKEVEENNQIKILENRIKALERIIKQPVSENKIITTENNIPAQTENTQEDGAFKLIIKKIFPFLF